MNDTAKIGLRSPSETQTYLQKFDAVSAGYRTEALLPLKTLRLAGLTKRNHTARKPENPRETPTPMHKSLETVSTELPELTFQIFSVYSRMERSEEICRPGNIEIDMRTHPRVPYASFICSWQSHR